jgi:hypothetical protein
VKVPVLACSGVPVLLSSEVPVFSNSEALEFSSSEVPVLPDVLSVDVEDSEAHEEALVPRRDPLVLRDVLVGPATKGTIYVLVGSVAK